MARDFSMFFTQVRIKKKDVFYMCFLSVYAKNDTIFCYVDIASGGSGVKLKYNL